jgi:hypothetical protein
MMAYATRTGTLRNLAALRDAGWGLMVTPDSPRTEKFYDYCIDNGAWSAHTQGVDWNDTYQAKFERLVEDLGAGARFIVAPDIVAAGAQSLARSLEWLPALRSVGCLVLIPLQDDMRPEPALTQHLGDKVGLFVGGSTEFKISSLPTWSWVAREWDCYLHVARVNTVRRIRYCQAYDVDSIDGTSASRYASTLPLLDAALRQPLML